MADNDAWDDYFKKKDRKKKTNKKNSGILTNTEELLKQLVSVANTAPSFRENFEPIEDDDEIYLAGENYAAPVDPLSMSVAPKQTQPMKSKPFDGNTDRLKNDEQDEWEESEDSHWKLEQLRLKYSRANGNEAGFQDDAESDNSMDHNENNNFHDQADPQKEKPAWKTDELKGDVEKPADVPVPVPVPATDVQPTVQAYVPPQRRKAGVNEVPIAGTTQSQSSRKKQPNIASTEEFPSLASTVNKK